MNIKIGNIIIGASILTVVGASSAEAQSTVSQGDTSSSRAAPTSENASSESTLQDIVVTAQKRSESVSKVGLSISAFSADTLSKQGVTNVAQLANAVPGLTYAQTDSTTPVYTIRGVGFYENSLAAYPAVSVYVDEVPLPFPALTSGASLDLERVEVLKGPQGILFGQNSTGGAINYIAAKPTKTFKAGFDLGYARFNDLTFNGYVSGPITDTLRARLAVSAEHGGPWQYSYMRSDRLGKTRTINARLLLDWDASDRLRFELNLNGWINWSDPQAPQYFEYDPTIPAAASANSARIQAAPFAPHNSRAADWSDDIDPHQNERMGQAALRAVYDLTDAISMTSITAYAAYRRRDALDTDGLAVNALDLQDADGDIKSFTQEIRFASTSSGPARWVLGGNFESSRVNEFDSFLYGDASTIDFFAPIVPAGVGWKGNDYFANQKMRNFAGFANLEYDVSPAFTLKVGGRYTNTWRSVESCQTDQGDGKWAAMTDFFNGYAARGIPLLPPGSCTTAAPNPTPGSDFGNPIPIDLFTGTLKEHNFSWRAGVDYHPAEGTLIYANLSRGYKAGSFPTTAAVTVEQLAAITQESILSFEVGVKQRLLGNRLSITAATFYYDYTDKQIRAGVLIPPFGVLDKLVNIPRSSVRGAEFEATFQPVTGLRLNGSVAFIDARIDKYTGIDDAGAPKNFDGTPIPFNSKWAVNGTADYEWRLGASYKAFVGATISYRSTSSGALGSANDTTLNPYTLLDLRGGVETVDGRWRLQVWGKNITGKYYWFNTVHAFDNNVRYAGRPATYGATISYRY